MKLQNTARHVGASSFSKSASRCFQTRAWLDRPFPKDQRVGGPAHIADVLPLVLRNFNTAGQPVTRRGVQ